MQKIRIQKLLSISRPRFWIYLFGPFLLGTLAAFLETGNIQIHTFSILFAVFFLLPANLFVYGINDIFDWETDRHNKKKEQYEALVTPKEHLFLFTAIIILTVPILFTLPFIPPFATISLIAFFFFGSFYSATPIRAKTKPVLDSVFNVLYIFPGYTAFFLHEGHHASILLFVAALAWVMAMHAYSAIPDIQPDKKAHIDTVATLFGKKGTLLFCAVLYSTASIILALTFPITGILLGSTYLTLIIISSIYPNITHVYRFFPVINTIAGGVLFLRLSLELF